MWTLARAEMRIDLVRYSAFPRKEISTREISWIDSTSHEPRAGRHVSRFKRT